MTEYEIGNISKLYADKDKARARPQACVAVVCRPLTPHTRLLRSVGHARGSLKTLAPSRRAWRRTLWRTGSTPLPDTIGMQGSRTSRQDCMHFCFTAACHRWHTTQHEHKSLARSHLQSAVQWADQAFSATMCHVPAAVARAKYAKGATLLALHVREQEQIRAQEQEASAESSRAAVDAEASRAGPAPAEAKAEAGAKPQQAAGSGAAAPKGPLKAGSVRDKGKGAPPPEPPVEEGPPPEPTLEDQGMRLLQEALDLAVDSMEYWTAMR